MLDDPEFAALPYDQRQSYLEKGISEASRFITERDGGWTPERWQAFGAAAADARQFVSESETAWETTKRYAGVAGQTLKDLPAIIGTGAVGLSPVIPDDKGGWTGQVPGETLGPALGRNIVGLAASGASMLSDAEQPLVKQMDTLKQKLDAGEFLTHEQGFEGWIDEQNATVKEAQKGFYQNDDWADQNSLLGSAENVNLLQNYLVTRSPQSWEALQENLLRSPLRAKLQGDKAALESDTQLGRALAPEARSLISEAADPAELLPGMLAVKKGADVLQRGASASRRVMDAAKGAAGEMLGEQVSASIDDPYLSGAERLQIAKDSLAGVLGLMGAGAGVRTAANALTTKPTKPQPTAANEPLPSNQTPAQAETQAQAPVTEFARDLDLSRMEPDERAQAARFAEQIGRNVPEAIATYRDRFQNHISADNARSLYEPWNESNENRQQLSGALGVPGGKLAQQVYDDAISQTQDGRVLFLAGGQGSGKTSAISDRELRGADVIYDNTFSNPARAEANIQKALHNGNQVRIHFIYKPLEEAVTGAIERAHAAGRIERPQQMAATHLASQKTFMTMAEKFADNPDVAFVVTDATGVTQKGGLPKPMALEDLRQRAYTEPVAELQKRAKLAADEHFSQHPGRYSPEFQSRVLREVGRGNGRVDATNAGGKSAEASGASPTREGDSLSRAIGFVAGDHRTNGGQRETARGNGTSGATSQAAQLADAAGVPLLTADAFKNHQERPGGNEHDVFIDPKDTGRAVKVTLPNFGLSQGRRVAPLTVRDYLERWKLSNEIFGDDARLVGVIDDPKGLRLVMSQPWVKAADTKQAHPTGKEVPNWLRAAGFEYQSGAWVRAEDGVILNDEHDGNWIKTTEGLRPIDVVMGRLEGAEGPVVPWQQTQQRLREAGLETSPASQTAADFNLDAPNAGNGGPGASSLQEWGKTTFGQRLRSDDRLRQSWRQSIGGTYRKETEAEWQQRANEFIEQNGSEGAFSLMVDPESGLSDSDRVALGLQLILHLDEQIKQTQLAGGDIGVLDDLLYETAEWVEQRGTKLGQAVRVFGMWTRMSAEGVLRAFERKVHAAREESLQRTVGEPEKIAAEVETAAQEERADVAAEALGETTAEQLTELQQQVAELRQQLAQAQQEASAAQQETTQATTPADAAQAQKRAKSAEKRRQAAQRKLAAAEANQQRKATQVGKPRPAGQKKPKQLNPAELAARLIARLSKMPGQQTTQRAKTQVQQLAEDYAAGRTDATTLQSSLQALGVDPAQAATLQQLLDVKAATKTAPETQRQKRQPGESALSRQAFEWIDRLTFRHVFGGPTTPQTTGALASLIRDYLKAPDAASLPDFNTQARAIGLPPAEAVELQRLLDMERKAHAEIARERAINRLMSQLTPKLATPKTRERMPRFLKKLVEAHELGTLDRPEFLKAYAEAFDLPMMDTATRQKLKALIDAQKAAPDGFLKQEETTKLMSELAMFKGIPALEVFTAFWYANVLSGLTTQGVNVWGNGVHLMLKTLTVGATHNPVETWHFIKGMFEGAKRGWVEAKAALKQGSVPYKGDLNFTHGQTLELIHSDNPQTWWDRFKNGAHWGKYVFRALGAGDAFFYHTAREGRAWLEAARYARTQEKLNGGAFSDYLAEQLNNGPEQFAAALAQAKAELANTPHAGSYGHQDRRAWEILETQRSEDLRAKSSRFGTLATFTQAPEGFMGWVAHHLNQLHNGIGTIASPWGPIRILTPVIPFVNIVANVTSAALDFTPVGISRGLMGRYNHNIGRTGQRDFDADEARDRIASGMLGTLGAGLLFTWAYAMRERDDDDAPFMIYGMGPGTKARRDQMPKGWKPYTIKIGDNYVGYAETPLSLVLAVAGGTLDYLRYNPKGSEEHALGAAAYALGTSWQALLKTGVLSSINDLFNLIEGQRSWTQVGTRTASGFVPGQGLLRDISELIHGDKIDNTTITAGLLKDVPIIRSIAGKPALNIFGEPLQLDVMQRLPIVKRMVTRQGEDPDTLWLARQKLWIPGLDNQIEVGTYLTEQLKMHTRGAAWRADRIRQQGRAAADVLTAEERYRFVKTVGPGIRQAVKETKAIAEAFPEATRQQLQDRLNAKIVAQRRMAMMQVLGLD